MGGRVGVVKCPDSHYIYKDIYLHHHAGEDSPWFQLESSISVTRTLNAAEASVP